MFVRSLPERPNLDHLRNQARTLLRERIAADPVATGRFAALGIETAEPKLADALHVVAREYGFETWPALKLRIEVNSPEPIEGLIAAIKADDASLVRQVLARNPLLKTRIDEPLPNYGFDEPALLSAVHKENREMVEALLDFGANLNARSRWWAGGFGVLDFAKPDLATYLIARGATVDIHSAARLGMLARVVSFWCQTRNWSTREAGTGSFRFISHPRWRSRHFFLSTARRLTPRISTMSPPRCSTWFANARIAMRWRSS